MASTYSPNLRIELIGTGEQSNTWGSTTNTNLGTLLEQAISGAITINVTAGNVTLSALDGASDQSRQMVIEATGTPGTTRTITAPAVDKVYIVVNNSDATLNFIASGGAGVSLIAGARKHVYCNGTNFYEAVNALTNPTFIAPTLGTPVSGLLTNCTGTAASLTAGNVTTNANLTGAVTSVGNASSLGSFTSAQLATALTNETGSGSAVFSTSPTLVTPALGTPSALVGTNITGTAASLTVGTAANLNGTWAQLPAGTRMPFAQAAAPTGWVKDVSDSANNRMLRVVTGTGGGIDGTDSPILNNTSIPAHTHTFTGNALGAHTHSDSGHTHIQSAAANGSYGNAGSGVPLYGSKATGIGYANLSANSAGTPSGTNSTIAAVSWAPRYIDMIICTKS